MMSRAMNVSPYLSGRNMFVKQLVTRCVTVAAAVVAVVLVCTSAYAVEENQAEVDIVVAEWSGTDALDFGISSIFNRIPGRPDTSDKGGVLRSADLTFPRTTGTSGGATLFLDRITLHEGEMEFVLEAIETSSNVRIIAKPHVFVLEGHHATIKDTDQVPYEQTSVVGQTTVQVTTFRQTGISLLINFVRLYENEDNEKFLMLGIDASDKDEAEMIVVGLDDITAGGGASLEAPRLTSRSIRTTVIVKEGDTVVLGGMMSERNAENVWTVPVLGKIPLLKYLFTSRSTTREYRELYFFVTPRLHMAGFIPLPTSFDEPFSDLDTNGALESGQPEQPAGDNTPGDQEVETVEPAAP